jgi:hypothetical protein
MPHARDRGLPAPVRLGPPAPFTDARVRRYIGPPTPGRPRPEPACAAAVPPRRGPLAPVRRRARAGRRGLLAAYCCLRGRKRERSQEEERGAKVLLPSVREGAVRRQHGWVYRGSHTNQRSTTATHRKRCGTRSLGEPLVERANTLTDSEKHAKRAGKKMHHRIVHPMAHDKNTDVAWARPRPGHSVSYL